MPYNRVKLKTQVLLKVLRTTKATASSTTIPLTAPCPTASPSHPSLHVEVPGSPQAVAWCRPRQSPTTLA
jgi:hypothetical protein